MTLAIAMTLSTHGLRLYLKVQQMISLQVIRFLQAQLAEPLAVLLTLLQDRKTKQVSAALHQAFHLVRVRQE